MRKAACISLIISVLTHLAGCKTLSKSQVKNINIFATSAKSYTAYPGEYVRDLAKLLTEERIISTIQLSNPEMIKGQIEKIQANYKLRMELADSINLSLELIQQYASLLAKLSSESYVEDLTAATKDLNENLNSLITSSNSKLSNKIPVNIGDAVTKAIFLAGERLTKNKQAKALKEFIPIGNGLIKIIVKNLVEQLQPDLLSGTKITFIDTYTNVILYDKSRINYATLSQYLNGLNDYDNLDQMRIKCIKSATNMERAHNKLTENIQSKKEIRVILGETQDFIVSLSDLYKTFKKISSPKNN